MDNGFFVDNDYPYSLQWDLIGIYVFISFVYTFNYINIGCDIVSVS